VPNAWPQEIPGWLHESEANVLTELARGKRVLEIGSYCGLSTVVMGRVAEHVTAVDYFDGRGTPEPMDTRERFNNSVARYGLGDKVTACHPDDSYPHAEYDLVYIDGAHDEGSVQADVQRAVSVLAPGGLLAFHDYKHPSHVGVENVVNKLIADGGELLSVTETLAVLKPPALIPLEV
jgi:predicted O-methyltransferase YrrM